MEWCLLQPEAWKCEMGRLQAAERLNKVGVIDDLTCLLCGSDRETHQHLFFNCPFSEAVIRRCLRWMDLRSQDNSIQGVIDLVSNSGGSRFRRQVKNAVICATAYQVWWARNDALWNNRLDMVDKQVYRNKHTCVDRIYCVLLKKISRSDRMWLR